MFFVSLLCVAALLAPVAAQAQAPAKSAGAGLPPLIDRELIFGNPEIAGAQISPDGQFIAFVKPYKDTLNVWVKKTGEPFSAAKLITADTKRPIGSFFWSRDSKYVLFVQDQAGDENYNVYAVNPGDSPAAGRDAPPARNLTEAKSVRAIIYDVPRKDPDVIHVGLNDRDAAWHDLYRVKISTGERTLLRKNTEKIAGWMFDNAGELRLAARSADNGDTEILRVDADGFKKIYSCTVFETCGPIRFHKDGKRVYLTTNKGTPDLTGLVLFDVATGTEEPVESDPLKRVDFGGARFSDVTDEILLTSYMDERLRRYFKDKALEADYKLLTNKLPGKEIGFASSTRDERVWLVSAFGDTEPGETYLFDRASKQLTLQYRVREKLAREHLAAMTSHPLQVVRRPRDSGVPDASEGRSREEPPADRRPSRRPVGARRLGLQLDPAVPREPRLRGAAAELPRLHRLREEVPERRQQRVGLQDAGRHHVGRQAPDRPGHCGPEARRHHGGVLRRLRDARRCRVHA